MSPERLLGGYVLRIAVHRRRWRLSLQDVKTGEQHVFTSFEALCEHLESRALKTSSIDEEPVQNRDGH
jgi:hypothetical protein